MGEWNWGEEVLTPKEAAWRQWVKDAEMEFETGAEASWYQDAFDAGWDANNLEQVRAITPSTHGLLLVPESMSFPHVDGENVAGELAEAMGMTVLCGPKEMLDGVEVSDLLVKAKKEAWDEAHAQMCSIGNKFCSAHRPSFWRELEVRCECGHVDGWHAEVDGEHKGKCAHPNGTLDVPACTCVELKPVKNYD